MRLPILILLPLISPVLAIALPNPNPRPLPLPTNLIITATEMPGGPLPTAVTTTITGSDDKITKCYTTTLTRYLNGEFVGMTSASVLTTQTVSTIAPMCGTYPASVVVTVVSTVTWEMRWGYDGKTRETSWSSGTYTKPVTTFLSGP